VVERKKPQEPTADSLRPTVSEATHRDLEEISEVVRVKSNQTQTSFTRAPMLVAGYSMAAMMGASVVGSALGAAIGLALLVWYVSP